MTLLLNYFNSTPSFKHAFSNNDQKQVNFPCSILFPVKLMLTKASQLYNLERASLVGLKGNCRL